MLLKMFVFIKLAYDFFCRIMIEMYSKDICMLWYLFNYFLDAFVKTLKAES